jgi:hypothetical protein
MERPAPINEDVARNIWNSIEDPITRNLVRLGVARALMKFAQKHGETEEEWRSQLPTSEFDVAFFVRILIDMCSQHDLMRKLLDGLSIEVASGWDV